MAINCCCCLRWLVELRSLRGAFTPANFIECVIGISKAPLGRPDKETYHVTQI